MDPPYQRPELLNEADIERKYPHRYVSSHEPVPEDYPGLLWVYELSNSLFLCREFLSLFDLSCIFYVCLSIAATVVCVHKQWFSDEPLALLANIVVIPASFSIGFAIDRRENLLSNIAGFKSHVVAMLILVRRWQSGIKNPSREYARDLWHIYRGMSVDTATYLQHRGGKEHLFRIFQAYDAVSKLLDQLNREAPAAFRNSNVTRAFQTHHDMMMFFERLRTVHNYRTTGSVRAGLMVLLYLAPILLAPLFASYSSSYGRWASLFIAGGTSLMIRALDRVQRRLEDPFFALGSDSLNMGMLLEGFTHVGAPVDAKSLP